jgi:neurotransmitter:Na+ symporter, NSS family
MPEDASIAKTIVAVALLDTAVALVSGMVIFPIVFSSGLAPGAGPGLLFQTLPIAFGSMAGGNLFGVLFFVLVVFAALTSSISLAEPIVAWLVESKRWSRKRAGAVVGVWAWLLGIGTVLSFNHWSGYTLFGKTLFDCLDFLTTNIMLPLGGLLIAVFVAWVLSKQTVADELRFTSPRLYNAWRFILMFISPLAVLAVLINGLL